MWVCSFLDIGMDRIRDQLIRTTAHVRCYGDRVNRDARLLNGYFKMFALCSTFTFFTREFAFPQHGTIFILVQQGAKHLFTVFNITKKTRISVSWLVFSHVRGDSHVVCRGELLQKRFSQELVGYNWVRCTFKYIKFQFHVLVLIMRLFFHCSDDGGVKSPPRALLRLHAQRYPSHGVQSPD